MLINERNLINRLGAFGRFTAHRTNEHELRDYSPAGFLGGDANLHRFVGNSFPNATDPSGRQEATGLRLSFIPEVKTTPNEGRWSPIPGINGNALWKVQFMLTKDGRLQPADKLKGAIVQRVRITGHVWTRDKNGDLSLKVLDFQYWEGWEYPRPVDATDIFLTPNWGDGSDGKISYSGEAVFLPDFVLKDNGFSPNNKAPGYIPEDFRNISAGIPIRWGEDLGVFMIGKQNERNQQIRAIIKTWREPKNWKQTTAVTHDLIVRWKYRDGKPSESETQAVMHSGETPNSWSDF